MKRLAKILAGCCAGVLIGAAIGALGGTMDRGSMLLLMPSGPPFWAIVGALGGGIAGALYGAFTRLSIGKAPPGS